MLKELAEAAARQGEAIFVQVAPEKIDLLNKLLEGYDNLTLVTTLDAQKGDLVLWVTKYTYRDTIRVIKHLPFAVQITGITV